MAEYSPRLTAPSTTNKNYLHYTRGGYNYCIRISGNSCLPNCVGYAWGRWREILGKKHNLSLSNAENWWGNTSDGYKRGQTPKVGAVMCWRKGKAGVASDGAGHVAVVEKVNADGSVTYSNSNYKGTRFYTRTLKAPYRLSSAYTFQGFIYLPKDFDEPKKATSTTASSTATSATKKKYKYATGTAEKLSKPIAGTYKVTGCTKLNVRNCGDKNAAILVAIPKDTEVKNYGYYTEYNGIKWLYIQFEYKDVIYTGFASSKYLKKIS